MAAACKIGPRSQSKRENPAAVIRGVRIRPGRTAAMHEARPLPVSRKILTATMRLLAAFADIKDMSQFVREEMGMPGNRIT